MIEQLTTIMLFYFAVDIIKGVRQVPKRKRVQVRILVEETNQNGVPKLYVEEEFTTVEGETVEQVDVHQIIWESNIRRPITIVKLSKSKIHTQPRQQDHPMIIHGKNYIVLFCKERSEIFYLLHDQPINL